MAFKEGLNFIRPLVNLTNKEIMNHHINSGTYLEKKSRNYIHKTVTIIHPRKLALTYIIYDDFTVINTDWNPD